MTPFSLLPELPRSFFSLWALMLCLAGIFCAVLAFIRKRYRFAVFSLFPFVCTFFLWQVLFDLHLFGTSAGASEAGRKLGGLPWICWTAALVLLTLAAALLLIRIMRYGKRSITPAAVKLCLDEMPCGVCCWRDNGRVLFSNICMNRLCVALTDEPLLNGKAFSDKAGEGIRCVEGKVWRFSGREFSLGAQTLHELIASDITAEYAETQALEKEKTELSRLKRKLQEYSLRIEDTVRRQEILQAKVNIHDEMNRLMLTTMAAGKEDAAALDRIFLLWEQNALLLCMQADETEDKKAVTRIDDLAKALGIRLHWQTDLPAALTGKQRDLFFTAAQEAVINAAKHAEAENMEISFDQDETSVCCFFANDGNVMSADVRFVGGLSNLALLAKEQGACVSAEAAETFTLSLRFPKNV